MAAVKFPQRVKRGSCSVTIYETPSKGRELYTLCYYADDGRRLRPTFSNYAEAKAHADEVVEKLARGQADVLTLIAESVRTDRFQKRNGPSGVQIDSSAARVQCVDRLFL